MLSGKVGLLHQKNDKNLSNSSNINKTERVGDCEVTQQYSSQKSLTAYWSLRLTSATVYTQKVTSKANTSYGGPFSMQRNQLSHQLTVFQ